MAGECASPDLASLLTRYELGLLGEEDCSLVEQHLLACDTCFAQLQRDSEVMARFLKELRPPAGGDDPAP